MKKDTTINLGPALIVVASSMWAFDALIRSHLQNIMNTWDILFFEHIFGLLLLLALFGKRIAREFHHVSKRDFALLFWIGLLGGVIGTYFFTRAFAIAYLDPIIFQKLQPLFVAVLSVWMLKEKLSRYFWLAFVLAVVGSWLISFGWSLKAPSGNTLVLAYSLIAVFAWSISTVLGRKIEGDMSSATTTFLRFMFGFILICAVQMFRLGQINFGVLAEQVVAGGMGLSVHVPVVVSFILIAILSGALPLIIYYQGLKTTKAHVATLCEGAYPVIGFMLSLTVLNPFGPPAHFPWDKGLGLILLFVSIFVITRHGDR